MITDTEILEGNKLIAEFMGLEGQHEEWCGNNVLRESVFGEMLYPYNPDKDWNDLMPVVEKIRQMHNVIAFEICFSLGISVKVRYNDKWHIYESDNALEVVWLAVIAFIKWYNQQSLTQKKDC